jgi:hypothetical protein
VLLVNIPIAAIGIFGALTVVRDSASTHHRPRIDIPGVILASVGLVSLVYGFSAAENDGWSSHITATMFIVAAVLLTAFVALEARLRSPLLPLRIVTERNRAGAYLSVGLAVISMFGMFLFLSYHLQLVLGYSPVKTGVAFLPLAAAQAFGSMQVGARLTPTSHRACSWAPGTWSPARAWRCSPCSPPTVPTRAWPSRKSSSESASAPPSCRP